MKKKTAVKRRNRKTKKSSNSVVLSSKEQDIISIILRDHKPIKDLIKIIKDSEEEFSVRREAFEEFAPLLLSHAIPESQVLYTYMRTQSELRAEAFEGDVEHALAEQMIEEAKMANDADLWSARVKVLAELVEHHLEEEEKELLPDFKKCSAVEEREALGEEYIRRKADIESYEERVVAAREVVEELR